MIYPLLCNKNSQKIIAVVSINFIYLKTISNSVPSTETMFINLSKLVTMFTFNDRFPAIIVLQELAKEVKNSEKKWGKKKGKRDFFGGGTLHSPQSQALRVKLKNLTAIDTGYVISKISAFCIT